MSSLPRYSHGRSPSIAGVSSVACDLRIVRPSSPEDAMSGHPPRERMHNQDAPIVVAVDGSRESYRAVAWAGIEAGLRGCRIEAITSAAPQTVYGLASPMTGTQTSRLR